MDIKRQYVDLLKNKLDDVYNAQNEKIVQIADMFGECMDNGGVVQLFGVKYGTEFVNELNYRAGGIAYYHKMGVEDLVLRKMYTKDSIYKTGEIYNDVTIIDKMYEIYQMDDRDMFCLVSEKGNEPAIIEFAKRIKAKGQKLVAVVSKAAYDKAQGTLLDYADAWIDMMASDPDLALDIDGDKVGQLGSTTTNIIAQMITAELYRYFIEKHDKAPVLLSANVKGADVHNNDLTDPYERRIRL